MATGTIKKDNTISETNATTGVKVYRNGNVVTVFLHAQQTITGSGWVDVAVIPSGYRPSVTDEWEFPVLDFANGAVTVIGKIYPVSGRILVYLSPNQTILPVFTLTYVI